MQSSLQNREKGCLFVSQDLTVPLSFFPPELSRVTYFNQRVNSRWALLLLLLLL